MVSENLGFHLANWTRSKTWGSYVFSQCPIEGKKPENSEPIKAELHFEIRLNKCLYFIELRTLSSLDLFTLQSISRFIKKRSECFKNMSWESNAKDRCIGSVKLLSSDEIQLKIIGSSWACHTSLQTEQHSGHLHYSQPRDTFTVMIESDLVYTDPVGFVI